MRINFATLLRAIDDAERIEDFERTLAQVIRRPDAGGIVDFFDVPTGDAFDVAPEKAIGFFKAKGLKPTFSYADMLGEAHDHAFTVAKMMDVDLLGQVQASLDSALANGVPFKQWADELTPILQASGWWGRKEVADPLTGKTIVARLGTPSRLETIFRTNMQSAYAAGQWQEIEAQRDVAPFLMYDAVDDHRTRPAHRAWDQTVLPVTHPWWKTHYPPNGWNCRCGTIQLDAQEVEALGLKVAAEAPNDGTYKWQNPRTDEVLRIPNGLDPGFVHNSGASYLRDLKALLKEKIGALPADLQHAAQIALAHEQAQEAASEAAKARRAQAEAAAAVALKRAQERAVDKAKQIDAQSQLDQIGTGTHPGAGAHYKLQALQALEKIPGFKNGTPTEQLEAVLAKAAQLKHKTELASKLSQYKKAVLAGKTPAPALVKAVESLTDEERLALLGKIAAEKKVLDEAKALAHKKAVEEAAAAAKAAEEAAAAAQAAQEAAAKAAAQAAAEKAAQEAAEAAAKAPAPAGLASGEPPNMGRLTQIGPQRGSNPGGLYQDTDTGVKWYVKTPASEDIARNEVLAAKLYELAGVEVPELHLVTMNGKPSIASKIVDGVSKGTATSLAKAAGAQEGFVVDAWLANWDVVGLERDNLLLLGKRAIRVDTGGALRYRAQGGLKGAAWNSSVDELESLRNAGANAQSASIFGKITKTQLEASAARVLAIADEDIRALVDRYGPTDLQERTALADMLIARKREIGARFPKAIPAEAEPPAPVAQAGARVTDAEHKLVVESRANGYAFRTDGDQIEDQTVLVNQFTDTDGSTKTRAWLKLRPEAARALQAKIGEAAADANQNRIDLQEPRTQILAAVKGINKRATEGVNYDPKDFQRAKKAVEVIEAAMRQIDAAIPSANAASAKLLNAERAGLESWQITFSSLIEKASPAMKATKLQTFVESQMKNIDWIPKAQAGAPARAPGIEWKRTDGYQNRLAEIDRSHLKMGDKTERIAGTSETYTATLPDGTRLTYIADTSKNDAYALRGVLQIDTPGGTRTSTTAVFETLHKLGIDDRRASRMDIDELFLNRVARPFTMREYELGQKYLALDKIPDQAERIKAKIALLNDRTDGDIERTDAWAKRDGAQQAFGHGRPLQYRPDFETPVFKLFEKDTLVYHNPLGLSATGNGARGTWSKLAKVINGGGMMASVADRIRRGVTIYGGASPDSDLYTGGGSYLFTRLRKKASSSGEGVYWKASILRRVDTISLDADHYGNVTPDNGAKRYNRNVPDLLDARQHTYNETIFKDGVSLFDDVEKIVLHDKAELDKALADLRSWGYQSWPDGRKLEDVLTYRNK